MTGNRVGNRLGRLDSSSADFTQQVAAVLRGEMRRERRLDRLQRAVSNVKATAALVVLGVACALVSDPVATMVFPTR